MTSVFSYQSFGVGATRVWNTDRELLKRWAEEQHPADREKFWVPYMDCTLLIVKNYIGEGYSVAGQMESMGEELQE